MTRNKKSNSERIPLEEFRKAYSHTEKIMRWVVGLGGSHIYYEKGFYVNDYVEGLEHGDEGVFQKAYPFLSEEDKERMNLLLDAYSSVMSAIFRNRLKFKVLNIETSNPYWSEYYKRKRCDSVIYLKDDLENKTSMFCKDLSTKIYSDFEASFSEKGVRINLNHDIDEGHNYFEWAINKLKELIKEHGESRASAYDEITQLLIKGLKRAKEEKGEREFVRQRKSLVGRLV